MPAEILKKSSIVSLNHQDTSEVETIPRKKKSESKIEVQEPAVPKFERYYCAACGIEVPLGAHKETDPETGEKHLLCLQCYLHKNTALTNIKLKKRMSSLEDSIQKLSEKIEKVSKTIEFIIMWEDIPL